MSTLEITMKSVNSWGQWKPKNKIEAEYNLCTYSVIVLQAFIAKDIELSVTYLLYLIILLNCTIQCNVTIIKVLYSKMLYSSNEWV